MEPKQTELIQATCPECRGPMTEVEIENLREFQCLVGHKYTARRLLEAHHEAEERILWAAIVALEESTQLVEKAGEDFPPAVAARLKQQAQRKQEQATHIREVLAQLEPFQLD
jgi:two-component system chemotaxis response regulator CheB